MKADIFMKINFSDQYYFFKNKDKEMLKFITADTYVLINHQKKIKRKSS